jgi:hypothetical protein
MELERIGNTIEAWFWLAFSLVFFIPILRKGEKHRLFCFSGGILLVIFGFSDFVEAQTGAWWRPWWLLAWKAGCNVGFAFLLIRYLKITPNWREKVFGKKKT